MTASSESALQMIAWSRIWSPLVDEEMRADTWQALALPDDYDTHKTDYWTCFHAGAPQPMGPLLLHAILHRECGGVRGDKIANRPPSVEYVPCRGAFISRFLYFG